MWKIRKFMTRAGMDRFIKKYGARIQWNEIFINQPTRHHCRYAIEYRPLRRVY